MCPTQGEQFHLITVTAKGPILKGILTEQEVSIYILSTSSGPDVSACYNLLCPTHNPGGKRSDVTSPQRFNPVYQIVSYQLLPSDLVFFS